MPAAPIEFHDVKGVVEQVLSRFEMRAMYFDRFPADAGITPAWLHPYRSARVVAEGMTVGWFGQLHPAKPPPAKSRSAVLIGELYLDRLYKLPLRKPMAREISRFQPVRRDFSLILDESVDWETIDRHLLSLQIPELVGMARARGVPRCAPRRQEYRSCWAPHSRRRTAPCAKRNCKFPGAGGEAVGKAGARLRLAQDRGSFFSRFPALYCNARGAILREYSAFARRLSNMSQSFMESEIAEHTGTRESECTSRAVGSLAVSADDFSALEERILPRRRTGQAASARPAPPPKRAARKLDAPAQRAGCVIVKIPAGRGTALNAEREQVRQRVERLLAQLDALEL